MISSELQSAVDRALACAAAEGRASAEVEHLLLSLLEQRAVVDWLKNEPSEIEALRARLRSHLSRLPITPPESGATVIPGDSFSGVIQRAILEAQKKHHLEVQASDVAYLILSNQASIARWASAS